MAAWEAERRGDHAPLVEWYGRGLAALRVAVVEAGVAPETADRISSVVPDKVRRALERGIPVRNEQALLARCCFTSEVDLRRLDLGLRRGESPPEVPANGERRTANGKRRTAYRLPFAVPPPAALKARTAKRTLRAENYSRRRWRRSRGSQRPPGRRCAGRRFSGGAGGRSRTPSWSGVASSVKVPGPSSFAVMRC